MYKIVGKRVTWASQDNQFEIVIASEKGVSRGMKDVVAAGFAVGTNDVHNTWTWK